MARYYIATITIAATATLWWLSDRDVVLRPLPAFVLLAVLAILVGARPLVVAYKGQGFQFSLESALVLALMTIYGVFPAAIVQGVASVVSDVTRRKGWPKTVFNASGLILSTTAAGVVLEAALGREIRPPGIPFGAEQLPALLLGLATYISVNTSLIALILRLAGGQTWSEVIQHFVLSRGSIIESAALLVVPAIAVTVRHNPLLALFLVAPIAAMYQAVKVALDNVSLLENQRIALEEKHAAEEALREREAAQVAAQRANRAKSDFLARMSHELRTPLNAVLGFAQLLDMELDNQEHKESVGEILKGGRHLLDLISEVLDISAIEVGRLPLSLEAIDVSNVARECLSLLTPLARDREITLKFEADASVDQDPYATADGQRLKQVLLNLVSNGIKYNHRGGEVSVGLSRGDDTLSIQVADTGPGIHEDKLPQLFVPFERLGAETSEVEGTGLGLVLAKSLVEVMGGELSVTSEIGTGTTFTVDLKPAGRADPAKRAEQDRRPEVELARARPPTEEPPKTVLYVDDNASNVRLIDRMIRRRQDIKLITAMRGEIGLTLAREHCPDLILLDVNLPDVPGMDVLQRLRSDPDTAAIRIVMLSADASTGQMQRFRDAGADDYLTKPLDIDRFFALLDR